MRCTGVQATEAKAQRAKAAMETVNPDRSYTAPPIIEGLEEQLCTALAAAKIWTSQFVMHMKLEERDRYFRQLDLMHDIDEWHGQDKPLRLDSYQGFIRFMLTLPGTSKPALGLTPEGGLLAAWQNGDDRLTVEFLDRENVEWVVSRRRDAVVERAAGKTHASRLLANLAPYHPAGWFGA